MSSNENLLLLEVPLSQENKEKYYNSQLCIGNTHWDTHSFASMTSEDITLTYSHFLNLNLNNYSANPYPNLNQKLTSKHVLTSKFSDWHNGTSFCPHKEAKSS